MSTVPAVDSKSTINAHEWTEKRLPELSCQGASEARPNAPILDGTVAGLIQYVRDRTAFEAALKERVVPEIERLLARYPSFAQLREKWDLTPFMRAILEGHVGVATVLLPSADFSARDVDGNGVLTHLARGSSAACTNLVMHALQEHPNVRAGLLAQNSRGLNPLMHAADAGNEKAVAAFLPWSDPSLTDQQGFNALMWAALRGHGQCVKRLIPVSDLHAKSPKGTALDLALRLLKDRTEDKAQEATGEYWWRAVCDTVDRLASVQDAPCAQWAVEQAQTYAKDCGLREAPALPRTHARLEHAMLAQALGMISCKEKL